MQDIQAGTIDVISSNRYGVLSKGICLNPFFSPDGKKVAFWTTSVKFSTAQTTSRNYELIVKDIGGNSFYYPNTNESNVFGNGDCPLIENNDLNRKIYNAAFSPDSTKILFTSHSTNLIDGEFNFGIIPDNKFRWYVKDLYTGIVTRVASTSNNDFGDLTDDYEALWYDNDNIVFTTYSNNLITENGYSSDTQDVYIKNIATGELSLVSQREDGNISPFLNFGCYNIDACSATNTVSFFSAELGYCIKNLLTTELTQVQNLTGLISNSIVSAEFFNFNLDGSRSIFRLSQNVNTFPNDLNEQADDFIYNFLTNQIEYINESSIGDFGNSTSKDSTFNISGNKVAFLSNSTNLDPTSTNDKFNLYVKDLTNGDITRVSKSSINGNINTDILGYCWLSDTEICYTSQATNLEIINTSGIINWYYKNIDTNEIIQINSYNMDTQFSDFNEYNNVIRKEIFDNEIKKILFVTNPEQLNYAVNSQGYNILNVFSKVFKNSILEYPPSEPIFAYPTESINSTVTSSTSAGAYTDLDNIVGVSTSIIGSTYVESVNSIQHRNDNDSSIRWMSLTLPELPDSLPNFAENSAIWITGVNTNPDPYFGYVTSLMHMDDLVDVIIDNTWNHRSNTYGAFEIASGIESSEHYGDSVFTAKARFSPFRFCWLECVTTNTGAFNISTGDFTIELFLRPNTSTNAMIFSYSGPDQGSLAFPIYTLILTNLNTLEFAGTMANHSFSVGNWYHIAVQRKSGVYDIFIDGINSTVIRNNAFIPANTNTPRLYIGAEHSNYGTGNGLISVDEFRFTKGIARYETDFTPINQQFPDFFGIVPEINSNQIAKFGAGIFLATNTLCDDFMTALIGTLAYFNVSPRNDVVIITAGDPQYQICAPIVYLQATIRGNESGHTFLWEQLVGIPVTLIQNSNTQAYFTSAPLSDFIFRFWIDITVYTTPTSFSSIQKWSNNAFNNTNIIDPELYSNSPILLSHTFDISIPFNSSGTTVDYNTGVADWSLPSFYNTPSTTLHTIYNNNFISTILQGYDSLNSIWYDLTEKTYNEVREFIGLTAIVRIAVKYKPLGHDSIIYYGNPQRITNSISGKTNLSKINYSNTVYNNVIRLVYVLIPLSYEDDLIKQIHTNSIYSNTQRLIYTLIDMQNNSDINKTIWSNVKIKFNITRTNGSTIGG